MTLFGEDKILLETYPIKVEDGKLLYDSGEKGEALGEEVSPWREIKETADGIEFAWYRLVKIEK